MIAYKPLPFRTGLGQASAAVVPPPSPDVLYTGYTGFPGILESLAVLGVAGAAAWIGITTGLDKTENKTRQIAGWVGGVGSALLGILYLGGKSGMNQMVSLPAVRVTPD
jgi:hypothetical protein